MARFENTYEQEDRATAMPEFLRGIFNKGFELAMTPSRDNLGEVVQVSSDTWFKSTGDEWAEMTVEEQLAYD